MFGISFEHILIVGVILIVVGPRRLPELGNTMGKAIKNFKDSFGGIEEASFKRILEPAPAAATVTPVAAAAPVTTEAAAPVQASGTSINPSANA
jgi:sec-independent protein translocase protein TatA